MNPIKITEDKVNDLQSILDFVNGKSVTHVCRSASILIQYAKDAESKMAKLGIPKKNRRGAKFIAVSGNALPNAYKYAVNRTTIQIERRSSDWYLINATKKEHYPTMTPVERLYLTEEQDKKAISKLREQYNCQ